MPVRPSLAHRPDAGEIKVPRNEDPDGSSSLCGDCRWNVQITRRLLREFFRLNPALFAQGVDWVVIAKEGAGALASGQIRDEVRAALQRRPKGSVRPPSAGDAPTS